MTVNKYDRQHLAELRAALADGAVPGGAVRGPLADRA